MPQYCGQSCKQAAKRKTQRDRYARVSVREALLREVEQGYWLPDPGSDPDAPTALLGMSLGEALVDESGLDWTVSRPSAGLRPADRRADKTDPRYPLDKAWADKGADIGGVPVFGGPYRHREPGWIPIDEWFAGLEDDGRAWVNGIGVDPQNMV